MTLLINDEFAMGVEVMLYSLREHSKIRRAHVVLVAPDVSELKRRSLKAVADHIIEVKVHGTVQEVQYSGLLQAFASVCCPQNEHRSSNESADIH